MSSQAEAWARRVAKLLLLAALMPPQAGAQVSVHVPGPRDTADVRMFVEALGRAMEAGDLAALDTMFAPDPWVEIIEGAGVNHGWVDYRDNHLKPELEEMKDLQYRFFEVLPQVRGSVAWAPFRYDLAADVPSGHVEVEGRGTAVLERRSGRWLVVQLHTSGRRKPAR